jgi:hypothetical protein
MTSIRRSSSSMTTDYICNTTILPMMLQTYSSPAAFWISLPVFTLSPVVHRTTAKLCLPTYISGAGYEPLLLLLLSHDLYLRLVRCKLSCRDALDEHLVQLLKRTSLGLGVVQIDVHAAQDR